ncbi:MAG TPA: glycosyl hydrolase, partial [Solirubrobacteraceae bacterium]|nr:glycosyl hydrolase [Solirubrobacteraceae bacterium]
AKGKAKGKAKKPKKPKVSLNSIQLGIADEKSEMFTDPLFTALGLKIARRSVSWDTFEYDWQVAELEDWMTKARAARVRPLISFNRSRVGAKRHVIPTRAQWLNGFRLFRARYPWVTDFVASNESNHTPPGFKFPKLAAQYYLDMKKACRHCKIAAATINERPEKKFLEGWIKRFIKAAGHRPKYWALHNYYGANTFSLKGTNRFLKATKSGEVWITESGGLVKRRTGNFPGKLKMKEGTAHAVRAWRFIFDKMLTASPRIKRAYLFHWNATGTADTWDSGLVGADGKPRGGLTILQKLLEKTRR